MEPRPDPRQIVWQNVAALMRHHWNGENLSRLAKEAEVGPATITRLKKCETYLQLDTIDALARAFDLAAWQLLVPNLEPSNPPVIALASPAERKLYNGFLAFKRAIEAAGGLPD